MKQAIFSVLLVVAVLAGCRTPADVKMAADKQVRLIGETRSAADQLRSALGTYADEKEAGIETYGRMILARQAIDVAVEESGRHVTADQLFELSNARIRPWVDQSFRRAALAAEERSLRTELEGLDQRIAASEDDASRARLELARGRVSQQLDDVRLKLAEQPEAPAPVAELEAVIAANLEDVRFTRAVTNDRLRLLMHQIEVMGMTAETVRNWLAIDVTLTQEQIDQLAEAYESGSRGIREGD